MSPTKDEGTGQVSRPKNEKNAGRIRLEADLHLAVRFGDYDGFMPTRQPIRITNAMISDVFSRLCNNIRENSS